MPWPRVKADKVILATGSFEQHGPHLPLLTDTLIADAVAEEAAKALDWLKGPTIPFGVSPEHMCFPGTVSVTSETLKAVVSDITECLREHGFGKVVIVNGHGGNNETLSETGADVVNLTEKLKLYDHAGEVETSLMMHLHPSYVVAEEIRAQKFRWPGKNWDDTSKYSTSGVFGYPEKASPEKGKKYFMELVDKTVEDIRDM